MRKGKEKEQKKNQQQKAKTKAKTKARRKAKRKVRFTLSLYGYPLHPQLSHAYIHLFSGAPAAKKQKTEAIPVDDDEGSEGANGASGERDEELGEEDAEEDAEEESAADTATKSVPAASAARAKEGVVPKESDLSEIEAAEEEQ